MVVFLLGLLLAVFLILFVGVKIAHSISNIETRYDPQTLRYKTK